MREYEGDGSSHLLDAMELLDEEVGSGDCTAAAALDAMSWSDSRAKTILGNIVCNG